MACHSYISHRLNDEALLLWGGGKEKPDSKTRIGLTGVAPVYISVVT